MARQEVEADLGAHLGGLDVAGRLLGDHVEAFGGDVHLEVVAVIDDVDHAADENGRRGPRRPRRCGRSRAHDDGAGSRSDVDGGRLEAGAAARLDDDAVVAAFDDGAVEAVAP